MTNIYSIEVSVVGCDGDYALATVSSPLCAEETFHIFNDATSDRRYTCFDDVADRISSEFIANGYNIPSENIRFETVANVCDDSIDYLGLDDELSFRIMCFDAPRDELSSFRRYNYTFSIISSN